jgi:hypothetical protein
MFEDIKKIFPLGKQKDEGLELEKTNQEIMKNNQMVELAGQEDQMFHMAQEGRSDLIRWQQDLLDDFENSIHELKSEVKSEGTWKKQMYYDGQDANGNDQYKEIPPLINDLGIVRIRSFIQPLISKNLINSNYSEDRIYMNLRSAINTIILTLRGDYQYFGIRKNDLPLIVQMIKRTAEPTYWRSYNNGERKYLTTIHKHVEARNETTKEAPENKGVMGGIKW